MKRWIAALVLAVLVVSGACQPVLADSDKTVLVHARELQQRLSARIAQADRLHEQDASKIFPVPTEEVFEHSSPFQVETLRQESYVVEAILELIDRKVLENTNWPELLVEKIDSFLSARSRNVFVIEAAMALARQNDETAVPAPPTEPVASTNVTTTTAIVSAPPVIPTVAPAPSAPPTYSAPNVVTVETQPIDSSQIVQENVQLKSENNQLRQTIQAERTRRQITEQQLVATSDDLHAVWLVANRQIADGLAAFQARADQNLKNKLAESERKYDELQASNDKKDAELKTAIANYEQLQKSMDASWWNGNTYALVALAILGPLGVVFLSWQLKNLKSQLAIARSQLKIKEKERETSEKQNEAARAFETYFMSEAKALIEKLHDASIVVADGQKTAVNFPKTAAAQFTELKHQITDLVKLITPTNQNTLHTWIRSMMTELHRVWQKTTGQSIDLPDMSTLNTQTLVRLRDQFRLMAGSLAVTHTLQQQVDQIGGGQQELAHEVAMNQRETQERLDKLQAQLDQLAPLELIIKPLLSLKDKGSNSHLQLFEIAATMFDRGSTTTGEKHALGRRLQRPWAEGKQSVSALFNSAYSLASQQKE